MVDRLLEALEIVETLRNKSISKKTNNRVDE